MMWRSWNVNGGLAGVVLLIASSCGGEAVSDDGTGGTGGAAACPQVAGTWTIASHCDPAFVGGRVTVTQSGCRFDDQTFGFTGTLAADGSFTAMSTIAAVPATCTGSATTTAITQSCMVSGGVCSLTLSR